MFYSSKRRRIIYKAYSQSGNITEESLTMHGLRVHEANLVALTFEKLRTYLLVDGYQVILEYRPPKTRISVDMCILDKDRNVLALIEFKNNECRYTKESYIEERTVKLSHLNTTLYFVFDKKQAAKCVDEICRKLIGEEAYKQRQEMYTAYRYRLQATKRI